MTNFISGSSLTLSPSIVHLFSYKSLVITLQEKSTGRFLSGSGSVWCTVFFFFFN